jgi:hypothetical protein
MIGRREQRIDERRAFLAHPDSAMGKDDNEALRMGWERVGHVANGGDGLHLYVRVPRWRRFLRAALAACGVQS